MSISINPHPGAKPIGTSNLLQKSELALPAEKQPQVAGKPEIDVDETIFEKIQISKESLADELKLLEEQNRQKKEHSSEIIDELKNRLTDMEQVLHSAVAYVSFDSESLKVVQSRNKNQQEGGPNILPAVALPEIKGIELEKVNLTPEQMEQKSAQDLERLTESIKAAKQEIELFEQKDSEAAVVDDKTEKSLEVAHQNAEAALSTYDAEEVFANAARVAKYLNEHFESTKQVHTPIKPDTVVDLLQ